MNLEKKISKIKALILDMDGVLVDSEPVHMKSFSKFMDHLDIDYDDSFLNSLIGFSVEHNVEKILTEKNGKKRITTNNGIILREKLYLEMIKSENLQAEKGIIDLINSCKENNIKIALATSSVIEQVNAILKSISGELDFTNVFDAIVSGDDVQYKKPAPDIYDNVLIRLQINPELCLAVEDSAAGITSAKKAGIDVVGITSPFSDEVSLSEADWLFDSVNSFSVSFVNSSKSIEKIW